MYLAAMHYNANSDRLQAFNKQTGKPLYRISYPKYYKGRALVRVKKTAPSYSKSRIYNKLSIDEKLYILILKTQFLN